MGVTIFLIDITIMVILLLAASFSFLNDCLFQVIKYS